MMHVFPSVWAISHHLESPSRRRLVLELMAFNDLRCSGSRVCRVTQLRQMQQDMQLLAEQRDAAGLRVEGAQKSLFWKGWL